MAARTVAYIRRSARSKTDPGDVSKEFQTATVRRLAGPEGATLGILDGDWGRSAATDATDKRLAFLGLMESIEHGDVSTLYAYATDRLARSVQWAARLLDACETAGTTIVTSEGRFEPGDDMARNLFQFQAITNENYSRQARKKARATVETRRARGSKLGPSFYGSLAGENLETVLATFDQVGSYNGTATALNALGIPARRGNGWSHSSVQRILEREGKVPRLGTRGAKVRAAHVFHRLLRCHCGRILTGSLRARDRHGRRLTVYRCIRAESMPLEMHGKQSVAEEVVVRWAKGEVSRLRTPEAVALGERNSRDRERLSAKRARLDEMRVDGKIDREDYNRRTGEVDGDLARLDDVEILVAIPAIDWSWPPERLNGVLRALWREVTMDTAMQPFDATWTVPEWRA